MQNVISFRLGWRLLTASTVAILMHMMKSVTSDMIIVQLFDAHCCRMGTAIEHPVPDRVKPSFVIFDIQAL